MDLTGGIVKYANRISVVIPAYNAGAYLKESVDSVLGQSSEIHEIIIVNDGSTDDTEAVARSFESRVKYCSQPNRGIAAARNAGIALAKGDLLAFLDADDFWTSDKIARQMAHLLSHPACDGVFGHMRSFATPERADEITRLYKVDPEAAPGCHAGTLLVRRSSFDSVGLFSEDLKAGEFIDWYARAQRKGLLFDMLDDVVMFRRIHGNNTVIAQASQINSEYLKIVKRHLDSRRAEALAAKQLDNERKER